MRLRQARRHQEALRTVQGKPSAILERRQEGRRRSRWRPLGGIRRREIEEEIKNHFVDANKMIREKGERSAFPIIKSLIHVDFNHRADVRSHQFHDGIVIDFLSLAECRHE